ncbi:ribonuclease H-like domain-containing protein, partial [Mycena rosella]
VLITNGNLELVDEGIDFIIRTDNAYLDGMDEWCTKQHGQMRLLSRSSGPTQACLTSTHSHEAVSESVLNYIKKWVSQRRIGILAGNSVHADRSFLVKHMPEIIEWLHCRLFISDTAKELSRRWYLAQLGIPRLAESNHRALDDIRGSMKELQWYGRNILIPPIQPPPKV